MRAWIRRSFQNRVFVTFLLITLVPLLLCDVLMLQVQVERSRAWQKEQAVSQLTDMETVLTDLFASFERVADRLADSTVARSVLRQETTDSRILYQVLFRDAEELRRYARFDICTRDGVCRYTTASTLPARKLDPDWGILRAAAQTDGLAYQAGTDGEAALKAARAIRSYDGSILGYLVITMTQENFDRLFGGGYGSNSNVILLDGFWQSAYCSQPAKAEQTTAFLRGRLLSGQTLDDREGECAFFVTREPRTGFYLVLHQPRVFSSQALRTFFSVSLTLGLLCLALCLLCAWWLSRHISKPVNRMDKAMEEVRRGNYDVHLEVDRVDELGRLAESFNRMTQEYRANLERSIQRQKELNTTKIRMMQAQLNPHFLYNTLDSLKWMGVSNGVPEIGALATDLATILRASISEEEFVTLEKELELIERYLEIQYIRFEDRFTCEIDIEERFQHCMIPKLALQPIVENAIIHGVAAQDDGYIKITAREEAEVLYLYVADNGCGIPPELLEKLNNPDRQTSGEHLGLYNVDRIVKLHFGPEYGIHITSVPNAGSTVCLKIPARTEEGEHAENIGG